MSGVAVWLVGMEVVAAGEEMTDPSIESNNAGMMSIEANATSTSVDSMLQIGPGLTASGSLILLSAIVAQQSPSNSAEPAPSRMQSAISSARVSTAAPIQTGRKQKKPRNELARTAA
jgi:hypothetical protein